MNTDTTWARNSGGHRPNPSLNPAKDLFDKVMDPLQFNQITSEDLVGENGLSIMSEFCSKIGQNPPIGQRTKKPMAASALKKYIEALCKELRRRFGREGTFINNSLFPSEDVNQLKKTFEDLHGRTLVVGSEEDALLRDYYPMPRQHSARTKLLPLHDFSNNVQLGYARSVDLLSICTKLLRTGQFLSWAMLLCANNAIGRGGEVKFLSYDKMFWDCYFGMVFFQWFQRKELKTSPSRCVYDWTHPELCVLFALGCYWALQNELVRPAAAMANPGSPAHRRLKFVFQNLHSVVDGSVASRLTSIIRSCVHAMIASHYTVKSLRAGAMSMLSWNPAVTYEECIAIGGWSTKASRDWHVWQCLVAIVPSVLALAGHPDPRALPYTPSWETLFADTNPDMRFPRDKFNLFLLTLFPNNLPEFAAPSGRLRPLMVVVGAIMIKNYRHMQDKCGADHPYVHKMRTVVKRIGLADDLHRASEKLRCWSKKINDDISQSNEEGTNEGTLMRNRVADKLQEVSNNVADLLRTRQQEQLNQTLILQEIREVKSTQSDIKTQLEELTQAIRQLTTEIRQAPAAPAPPAVTPRQPPQQQPVPPTPQPPTPPAAPPSPPAVLPPPPQQQQQQRTPLALIRAGTNVRAGGRGNRNGDTLLGTILGTLHEENDFSNLRVNVSLRSLANKVNMRFLNGDNRNIKKVEAVLDLVDCLWSPEETLFSINRNFENEASAAQVHREIDSRVKRTCHIFDDPGDEWKPNSRRSSAVAGVGNLVIKKGREHFQQQIASKMPKWGRQPPITPGNALWDLVVQRETAIKARVRAGHGRRR